MTNDLLEQMVVHQEMARRAHEAAVWRLSGVAAGRERRVLVAAVSPAARLRSLLRRAVARRHGRQPELIR